MKVFQGLDPSATNEGLVDGVRAVISHLHKLQAPRSLCEIGLDEEDYEWLCRWARRQVPSRVRWNLEGLHSISIALTVNGDNLTYADTMGCLFLLLASEAGRREASEGSLWPAVRRQFRPNVENILFLQGQPREILKDAMQTSVRKLNLRHVYGRTGTQEYYVTVYLQFGFTRSGLSRLPFWLAGQGTSESVQYLTGAVPAALLSNSFLELWDALRDFRRNNISADRARNILATNRWILPEWTDELLIRARERLYLGIAESGQAAQEEQAPPQFLSPPRLKWDRTSAPEFASEIMNLAEFDLTSDRYLVKSGGEVLSRLHENSRGGYSIDPEQAVMSADIPDHMVTIVDDSGVTPGTQVVTLWDPMEEIQCFDLSNGRLLNEANDEQLVAGREYGLMVSDDLEVEPSDMPFHQVGGTGYAKRLYLVRGGEEETVRVRLEGEEIWRSEARAISRIQPTEPDWTEFVNVQLNPSNRVNLAQSRLVSLSVSGLDEETRLNYIRTGTIPRDFVVLEDGTYNSDELDILSILSPKTTPNLNVMIGMRRGHEQAHIQRSFVLSVTGVLRVTNEGLQVVSPQEPMSSADARGYAYRILPPTSDRRDLALMESSVFLRRLWTVPRPLESVGGYGGPLRIRAPYNWVFDHDLLTVSSESRDRGIVDAAIADQSGLLQLWLNQPLEPGKWHAVVFWTPGESPVVISADESVTFSTCLPHIWDVMCPKSFTGESGFVAISYSGARIGAWWPEDPWQILLVDSTSARETAAMLRWMHAPIVSPGWFETVRNFAQQHPAQVLGAWLQDDGLSHGLLHGISGEQWRSAVRQVFSEWTPETEAAIDVVRELRDETALNDEHAMYQTLRKLLRLDPLLMGRLIRAFTSRWDMRRVIKAMRQQLAELPPNSTSSDIADREEELLHEVSTQMGMDPGFLDRGIVRRVLQRLDYSDLGTVDRNNAEVALSVAPFREYLGLKVLSSLAN